MRAPCLGCEDRTVTPNCHMGCVRYQAFCTERERIRQRRLDTMEMNNARNDNVKRMIKSNKTGKK